VAAKDPYELLGVPRDASDERIRGAYELEINRATRNGAFRHAAELSAAYDTICDASRRALFERHGLTRIRERSPGAIPPPTEWRGASRQDVARGGSRRRGWKTPVLSIFTLGVLAGLILAAYVARHESRSGQSVTNPVVVQPVSEHQVLCQATPAGNGYIYSEVATNLPHCTNGASPVILGHN